MKSHGLVAVCPDLSVFRNPDTERLNSFEKKGTLLFLIKCPRRERATLSQTGQGILTVRLVQDEIMAAGVPGKAPRRPQCCVLPRLGSGESGRVEESTVWWILRSPPYHFWPHVYPTRAPFLKNREKSLLRQSFIPSCV